MKTINKKKSRTVYIFFKRWIGDIKYFVVVIRDRKENYKILQDVLRWLTSLKPPFKNKNVYYPDND